MVRIDHHHGGAEMVEPGDAQSGLDPYGAGMTTTDATITSPAAVIDATRSLGPAIAARAAEVEAARRIPRDLLDDLLDAGCFGVLKPTSHGGIGADLPTALAVYEELARADASVGWTVMIGSGSWLDLASLPRATFDELFDSPEVITAGVFNPTGTMEPRGDGYVVDGRWAFASGCEHATWLFGNCIAGVVDGAPQLRFAVFGRGEVVIEDTWTVSGLRGTGSHHFHVDAAEVPSERTCGFDDPPCIDAPVTRVPEPSLFAMAVASAAMGTALGALDDIRVLAFEKTPLLAATSLAGSATFHRDLATADTELRAARSLLADTAAWMWHDAEEATPLTLEQRARVRAAAAWATARAVDVVDFAYRSGGGGAVYADSPLQRRLRDVHAITQHFLVRPDTMTTAGAVFAGQEPVLPVF
jgi:alkylation response protein AidB-like acyl-CoA dehydrogenase